MKLENIKAIYFDIGYTLCKPATGNWRVTKKFLEYVSGEYLANTSPETIKKAYVTAYDVLNNKKVVSNLYEEVQINFDSYKSMIECFSGLAINDADIKLISEDRTYNMHNYIFYDGVKEVFETLKERYSIGIISDTWPSADLMLKEVGVYEMIDSFTYSCYLGIEKPDEKMYKHALNSLGLKPENALFVDDSIKNLETAKNMGMIPILILTKEAKGNSDFIEIENLTELLMYL